MPGAINSPVIGEALDAVFDGKLFGGGLLHTRCPNCKIEDEIPIGLEIVGEEESIKVRYVNIYVCRCGQRYELRWVWPPSAEAVYRPERKRKQPKQL